MRESRREELTPDDPRRDVEAIAPAERPEEEATLADSIGVALLILLDALPPAERVAFVLHDTFDVPFDDIAAIVGRTPHPPAGTSRRNGTKNSCARFSQPRGWEISRRCSRCSIRQQRFGRMRRWWRGLKDDLMRPQPGQVALSLRCGLVALTGVSLTKSRPPSPSDAKFPLHSAPDSRSSRASPGRQARSWQLSSLAPTHCGRSCASRRLKYLRRTVACHRQAQPETSSRSIGRSGLP